MIRVPLREFALQTVLWQEYVAIDYGRKVPEKGYKGFRTYVMDKLGVIVAAETRTEGLTIEFNSDEEYVMFKLQYG
jgi:hypothetical protein